MSNKQTVIFDFDGVVHSYTSGWKGPCNIPDPPVPGIRQAIKEIREHYEVVILSTRCFKIGGVKAIVEWLSKHDIKVDDIVFEKVPAVVSIDDRCITFDGDPNDLLYQIQNFTPWNKKPQGYPLGVIPRDMWDARRLKELKAAICRYMDAGEDIPKNWVEEYNELHKSTF